MNVMINDKSVELQKKDRKIGSEAPAVKLKMLSGDEKVIGMMADKVQVIFTLPYSHSLNEDIIKLIHKHRDKTNIYLISSDEFFYKVNKDYSSKDFKKFSIKFGVYINDDICAKSVFIIDKEGEIVYKDILPEVKNNFDINKLNSEIQKAVDFKRKGHIHENWMAV